jgi:integrase
MESLAIFHYPRTKERKERLIFIINKLKKELDAYLKIRGKTSPSDYVFIYTNGNTKGQPARGMRVYWEFKRYCKEAEIPAFRPLYGMRHQAVTTWIEVGFHAAEASCMAGHSSQKVAEKYTHLTAKWLKDKMGLI